MCDCVFCKPCVYCGHKADEHLAGDGNCFICDCPRYAESMAEAFANLNLMHPSKFPSFEEFVNKWCGPVQDVNKS